MDRRRVGGEVGVSGAGSASASRPEVEAVLAERRECGEVVMLLVVGDLRNSVGLTEADRDERELLCPLGRVCCFTIIHIAYARD